MPTIGATVKGDQYRRLGRGAKLAYALATLRDDPVACAGCGVAFVPAQLEAHQARCAGMAWVGSLAPGAWLPWAVLRDLGLRWGTVHRWLIRGKVTRAKRGDAWVYSRADVVAALEELEAKRRGRASRRARLAVMVRWRRVS